jgi:Kef-type K+ transport system membrane component KefB
VRNYLNVLAQLGIVVFIFAVGLEVDLDKMRKTSSRAAFIALGSVATPFLLGMYALGDHLHASHSTITLASGVVVAVPALTFKLFLGTAMSVTAFPVLARIIIEKGLHRLTLGTLALTCAALNDVVAWTLLAVVLAVQKAQQEQALGSSGGGGGVAYGPVLAQLGWLLLTVLVMFVVVSPLMRITVLRPFIRTGALSPNRLAWTLAGMFLSAWLLHHIGFHAMLGSFLYGLAFPRGHGSPFLYVLLARVEAFTTIALLPLFFITVGLSIDLGQLKSTGIELLWILLVSAGGKLVGSTLPALLAGCGVRRSIAVGVLMDTRGLTEIVVLQIAKQANILDDAMFTMLVMMAIITTCATGPLLRLIYPPAVLLAERKTELELKAQPPAAAAATEPASPPLPPHANEDGAARVVILLHDLRHASKLIDAALATLTPGLKAFLAVAHYQREQAGTSTTELGTGLLRSAGELAAKREIKEQLKHAERGHPALQTAVEVRQVEDPGHQALAYLRTVAPQVVVTDWPADGESRNNLKAITTALVALGPLAPTIVLWGAGTADAPDQDGGKGAPGDVANARTLSISELTMMEEMPPSPPPPRTADGPPAVAPTGSLAGARHSFRVAVRLLHDPQAQDAAVDKAHSKLQRLVARAAECIPLRVRLACVSWCCTPDDEGGDDDAEADGAEEMTETAPQSPRVESTATASVVTRHTMAMGAAQSLNPKGDKLLVSGWPAAERDRSDMIAFLHDVQHDALVRRASRRASHRPLERRGTGPLRPQAVPNQPPPVTPPTGGEASQDNV